MTNLQRRHRNKIDYITFRYYRNFKTVHPNVEMTQIVHTKILKTFFNIVVRKMIQEMFRFNFVGLGTFFITKEPPKMIQQDNGNIQVLAPVNWKETMKIRAITGDNKKKVVYLNNHTHGYIYKFRWEKNSAPFVNKNFYSFIAADSAKNELKRVIQQSIKPLNAYMP